MDSRKNGGSGFIFVFLLFDSLFWSTVAHVVFSRALKASVKGIRCLQCCLLLLWMLLAD